MSKEDEVDYDVPTEFIRKKIDYKRKFEYFNNNENEYEYKKERIGNK